MNLELRAALSLIIPNSSDFSFALESLASEEQLAAASSVLEWCKLAGATVLYPGHADYPFNQNHLETPPKFLSYIGAPAWKNNRCVAVVGSREPSRDSLAWMETHLSEFIRKTQTVTVSGGARGIDQKAHLISLRAKHPTIVFLPSGLGNPYPQEWREWQSEVLASGGAVVSTYLPMQQIRRRHFEERNRLIAALGVFTFVVEARRKSGSSMTARLAREINRAVCCLPGSPTDPRCAGTVDLLFEGGQPIRDAHDLESLLSLETGGLISAKRSEA
jgi:DNA processing protein